jgi:hypothetical protein
LRACDWHGAPFGKLNATPPDGRPVTQFPDRDQALLEVARAVRGAAEMVSAKSLPRQRTSRRQEPLPAAAAPAAPRSSNLRLAKQFSERDKDAFRVASFEFMAKFFENSLEELSRRNPGVETDFRRIDANRFSAKVYKGGQFVSRCTVFIGGGFVAGGIAYSSSETSESNAYNEMLSVQADEHAMYLRSTGMAFHMQREGQRLSQEGASELYWSMLIEPLQYRQ